MSCGCDSPTFEEFSRRARPALVRALVAHCGVDDASDAAQSALLYAFENWGRVSQMDNPVGYLYRVGQSSSRHRAEGYPPPLPPLEVPDVEPGLVPALLELPATQRTAVWLVHGCGWTYAQAATAMGVSRSMIGTHLTRALSSLRQALGVDP
jgi:RNA polymerase sigma-70 factor (ECF subfamily)